ncbi:L-fucose:H+ symporter permease [Larsenimonas rhizosphaerae]|uniref:L-fucose:H+ symporter permease n=1 Tax=Larsenimonas rhizosphaerae TaxID=2944682 RepID=A0AA42CTF8_9GAMM|nr:L-fucose:H+ symporter permease [Larsenimonas rhizosphaerae]MCM2130306.1 L-fucose:H+ symporter permease [Larsenimonas rhizosphaerae]MCX2523011.1 L-fucose:H+ symporter permease [Larsenimonas rhizosphaerae]
MATHASSQAAPSGNAATRTQNGPLAVVTTVFFMWGFITCLNDILIPHLKAVFSLNYTQSMLIQFTFFGAYFIMSMPAAKILTRIGYKNSISLGLLIAGLGAIMFVPAAMAPSYALFLLALFVLATGVTMLQVSANPYVTLLGPEHSSSSRLNLAQAFNSLGTTVAPLIGGAVILSGAVLGAEQIAQMTDAQATAYKISQAQSVQVPYIVLAAVLVVLSAIIFFWKLPHFKDQASGESDTGSYTFKDALRHRHVKLGVIALFLYVGAEVSIGSFMVNYLAMPSIGNMTEASAAHMVTFYWGGAMIGRFIGSVLMRSIRPELMLGLAALIAAALLGTTVATTGHVAMYAIVAIGLFNSIMFPTIFTLGIARLGPLTGKASSLLIMAIVGGALLPVIQGTLADSLGLQVAFLLPLLCYLFIAFYGFKGSKVVTPVK